jgi:hypothetical protein
MSAKNLRPKDNSKFFAKNVKGYQPKDEADKTPNKETAQAMQDVRDGKTTKGLPYAVAPKLPVAEVSQNSTLKCQVAEFRGLFWLGIKNAKGETFWRACGVNKFKTLMDKAEAIRADAALDDKAKDAKVSEAIKSFANNPVPTIPFSMSSEKGFDKPEAAAEKPADAPAV